MCLIGLIKLAIFNPPVIRIVASTCEIDVLIRSSGENGKAFVLLGRGSEDAHCFIAAGLSSVCSDLPDFSGDTFAIWNHQGVVLTFNLAKRALGSWTLALEHDPRELFSCRSPARRC